LLISIIGVIVVLSVMILSHELGHFIMAKKMGVRVEAFSLGFGPKLWSTKKGETEYKICLVPLGGYVKMAGEESGEKRTGAEWEFYSKPAGRRFNIIAAGPVVNYLLGIILFCIVFMMGTSVLTSHIGEVMEGYPAEKAGLKAGDRIIEMEGKKVESWTDVTNIIYSKKEGNIELSVKRNKRVLDFIVERESAKDLLGRPVRIIGIKPSDEVEFVKYGLGGSLKMAAGMTWNITALTYRAIGGMLTGAVPMKGLAGPVRIFAITGQAAKAGIVPLLSISALISVSLAIINLLPLPPLDGGHILFLGIEKLRGRPIDVKVQETVQQVGWVLLMTLLVVVSWNDITSFFK